MTQQHSEKFPHPQALWLGLSGSPLKMAGVGISPGREELWGQDPGLSSPAQVSPSHQLDYSEYLAFILVLPFFWTPQGHAPS